MSLLWPILARAVRTPRRAAIVDDRRTYSCGQVVGGAMFAAEQIEAATGADHVAILLPASGAFAMTLLGTWFAGRVAVPLNYLLSRDELNYVIRDCDADTIVTVPQMIDFIGGVEAIPDGVRLLDLTQIDFTGVPPLRWPPMAGRDRTAVILYTSGTSGRPKGVVLTHGNLHSNVDAAIEHASITQLDTFLGVLPQFHSFGLTAMTLIPLRAGSKVVYSAKFSPLRRIVELIRKHRPGIFMAIPSMYGALLSAKDLTALDLASIRIAISGAEPLPDAIFEQYRERFNVHIMEGYGLTETAPVTNWSTPKRHRLHSVGPSLPGVRVVIVDDEDNVLPPGRDGEILIAGPNVMAGYYKQPQLTAEAFVDLETGTGQDRGEPRAQRFFRTGDVGHLDHDGFLFITGRKKEMLIIGGENVFPREIEEVLNKHPSVGSSAVIGQTDTIRGEVPVAFVEIQDGQEFNESELRSWCRENLATFKTPRKITRVDQLPRNPTGKIMRRELREESQVASGESRKS